MRMKHMQMNAGYAPAFNTETMDAPPAADAPPAPAADAPPPAAPRTYTAEEMSATVQQRLGEYDKKYAPYRDLGDPKEVRDRLTRLERMEKAARGEVDGPTPEEQQLRELFAKMSPHKEEVEALKKQLGQLTSAGERARLKTSRARIASLAKDHLGAEDADTIEVVENLLSASIQSNKEDLEKWASGDDTVLDTHFKNVLEKRLDPLFRGVGARYVAGKKKDLTAVPPPTPKGGTQAPVSKEKKLTGEERREQAWKHLKEQEGQE